MTSSFRILWLRAWSFSFDFLVLGRRSGRLSHARGGTESVRMRMHGAMQVLHLNEMRRHLLIEHLLLHRLEHRWIRMKFFVAL